MPAPPGNPPLVVGTLLGLAAALIGISLPLPSILNLSSVLVVAAFVYAVTSRGPLGNRIVIGSFDVFFLVYVAYRAFVEYFDAEMLNHAYALASIGDLVTCYLAFAAARLAWTGSAQACTFLLSLTAPAPFVAVLGIFQLVDLPGLNSFIAAHTNSGGLTDRLDSTLGVRATSTIGHWTSLGGYLSCAAAVVATVLLTTTFKIGSRQRQYLYVALALIVAGDLATVTFAVIFVGCAVLLVVMLRGRHRLPLVIGTAIGAVAATYLFGNVIAERVGNQLASRVQGPEWIGWMPSTVRYRAGVWVEETIPAILRRPLSGWGNAVYERVDWPVEPHSIVWPSPESEWLRTLVSAGVVALVLQLLWLASAWRQVGLAQARSGVNVMAFRVFFVAILAASCLHSHFSDRGLPLLFAPVMAVFASLAARGPQPVPNSSDGGPDPAAHRPTVSPAMNSVARAAAQRRRRVTAGSN